MKKIHKIVYLILAVLLISPAAYSYSTGICKDNAENMQHVIATAAAGTYQTNVLAVNNQWTLNKFNWYVGLYEGISDYITQLLNHQGICNAKCANVLLLTSFDLQDLQPDYVISPNVPSANLQWYANVNKLCGVP
jgi:hypothetical protein